jgi:PAS domain S-box-containing protein
MGSQSLPTESQLLWATVETAGVAFCVVDAAGDLVMISPSMAELLQKDSETLLGRHYSGFAEPIKDHHKLFPIDAPGAGFEALLPRMGLPLVIHWRARLLIINNSTRYKVVTAQDVTDRAQLQVSLDQLKDMLSGMKVAMVVADATKTDMPIVYVNEMFELTTGYTANEVLGKNCRFLQGTKTEQAGVNVIREAIKQHLRCRALIENFRKDGSSFLNELYLSPTFNQEGQLQFYVGVQLASDRGTVRATPGR